MNDEMLYATFKHFDHDNTGYITKENLLNVISPTNHEHIYNDEYLQSFSDRMDFLDFKQFMAESLMASPIKLDSMANVVSDSI